MRGRGHDQEGDVQETVEEMRGGLGEAGGRGETGGEEEGYCPPLLRAITGWVQMCMRAEYGFAMITWASVITYCGSCALEHVASHPERKVLQHVKRK